MSKSKYLYKIVKAKDMPLLVAKWTKLPKKGWPIPHYKPSKATLNKIAHIMKISKKSFHKTIEGLVNNAHRTITRGI
ncbi:MAG TPA: hypothetical protein DCP55_07455 [Chitinophagaceae bacterium]|nr:hypothetical protein [Pseudomonadota bacterium]HAL95746.1 hypothetical protein [Chitinophagaceae bacterium]